MGAATHILTVDVGNTTTRLGVYTLPADREDAAAPELIGTCDLTTPGRATADELRIQLAQAQGMGADAVVSMRYATSAIAQGAAEMVAYGTAVRWTE